LEWNGHSLAGKSYEDVHNVIADSRLDPQVELRVARASSSSITPSAALDMGRQMLGPEACLSRHSRPQGRHHCILFDV